MSVRGQKAVNGRRSSMTSLLAAPSHTRLCLAFSVAVAALVALTAFASTGRSGERVRRGNGEAGLRTADRPAVEMRAIDGLAREYVRLARALIARDADSASGDSAGSDAAVGNATREPPLSLADIAASASAAGVRARDLLARATSALDADRAAYVAVQLNAVSARAALLGGARLAFDQELTRLYDRPAPVADPRTLSAVASARREVETMLPGAGSPAARLAAFDERMLVPRERLPAVFERALAECRERSRALIPLPDDESVEVGYVVERPWSGFSRYLGGHRSRVEVNRSLPLTVDRALDLACHEGYPGHHAINTWRDRQRTEQGWVELEAVPLFSPASFLAEAWAGDAAALVFSDDQRLAFERDVLFPLAGLDPADAEAHVRIARLLATLRPAIADSIVRYLRGELDYVEAGWALTRDALMQHPQGTLAFVHRFRGFALAYVVSGINRATGVSRTTDPSIRLSDRSGLTTGLSVAEQPAAAWAMPPTLWQCPPRGASSTFANTAEDELSGAQSALAIRCW